MSIYHDSFDLQTQCEEVYNTDPDELAEVMALTAEPEPEWDGYGEWSEDLDRQAEETEAWEGSLPVDTPHGTVLIKKACEHTQCPHIRCEHSVRLGGIEI